MRAKLIKLYLHLQSDYWLVPMVMVVLAIFMAFATTAADAQVGVDCLGDVDWLILNQPDGARALLSTIVGSMITVAGDGGRERLHRDHRRPRHPHGGKGA